MTFILGDEPDMIAIPVAILDRRTQRAEIFIIEVGLILS
jgi:hypothetical protein